METITMAQTDRIEKKIVLRAPRSRVWEAITDSKQFGEWFRVNMEGPFTEGRTVRGKITIPGYEHAQMEMVIDRIEPEKYFAYRWHPYAVDQEYDYSKEPMTLVEFQFADTPEGTALTITESGFDKVPPARRSEAFRMNDQGWSGQIRNIERYVTA